MRSIGRGSALLGGVALGVSLWQSWYRIDIPREVYQQIDQAAGTGPLGGFLRSGFDGLAGSLQLTGWQALHGVDVVLIVLAGIAVVTAVLGLLGRPVLADGDDGTLLVVIGMVAAGLVFYRVMVLPEAAQAMTPAGGIQLALASAAVVTAGGLLARHRVAHRSSEPVHRAEFTAPPTGTQSVPPPGR